MHILQTILWPSTLKSSYSNLHALSSLFMTFYGSWKVNISEHLIPTMHITKKVIHSFSSHFKKQHTNFKFAHPFLSHNIKFFSKERFMNYLRNKWMDFCDFTAIQISDLNIIPKGMMLIKAWNCITEFTSRHWRRLVLTTHFANPVSSSLVTTYSYTLFKIILFSTEPLLQSISPSCFDFNNINSYKIKTSFTLHFQSSQNFSNVIAVPQLIACWF
jgi:hypothetical protein